MHACSKKLDELDNFKLCGAISMLCLIHLWLLLFIFRFFCSPRDSSAQRPCQCLFLWFLLAKEQWFSLGRAFLIIDTLCYGEGLMSTPAFWFFCLGFWATPGCTLDSRHHNSQWFRHQPVWQRVCDNACARRVTWERRVGKCLLDITERCTERVLAQELGYCQILVFIY